MRILTASLPMLSRDCLVKSGVCILVNVLCATLPMGRSIDIAVMRVVAGESIVGAQMGGNVLLDQISTIAPVIIGTLLFSDTIDSYVTEHGALLRPRVAGIRALIIAGFLKLLLYQVFVQLSSFLIEVMCVAVLFPDSFDLQLVTILAQATMLALMYTVILVTATSLVGGGQRDSQLSVLIVVFVHLAAMMTVTLLGPIHQLVVFMPSYHSLLASHPVALGARSVSSGSLPFASTIAYFAIIWLLLAAATLRRAKSRDIY